MAKKSTTTKKPVGRQYHADLNDIRRTLMRLSLIVENDEDVPKKDVLELVKDAIKTADYVQDHIDEQAKEVKDAEAKVLEHEEKLEEARDAVKEHPVLVELVRAEHAGAGPAIKGILELAVEEAEYRCGGYSSYEAHALRAIAHAVA